MTDKSMEWNILGHEWAVQMLKQHIARKQVRHAYLFTGPPGVGRRTLALRFAKAINCPQPVEPGVPCGSCRICNHMERMQQVDLSVVEAEKEGGILKVDQIRELQHRLSLTPYEARFRVALLLRFHEANPNAQNALLKTLEEAPVRVILLLTADAAELLLPTIVSRCEVMRLRPMEVERLAENLRDHQGIPQEEASRLAHISGGRVGYALRLHSSPESDELRSLWLEGMMQTLGATRRERFAYVEQNFRRNRNNLRQAIQVWLSFWRDVMLCTAGSDANLVNLDWESKVRFVAGEVDFATARDRTADMERGLAHLEANVNPQLLAEVLLLDLPHISQ